MAQAASIPSRSKRRWLWLWLQDRRRNRSGGEEQVSLLNGLVQFYKPLAGATFLKSLGEGEAVPSNPFNGIVTPYAEAYAGTYALGDSIRYDVLPYRQGAQRVYAGVAIVYSLSMDYDEGGFVWPGWTASPGWVSGFSVLRYVNGTYAGYIDVAMVSMQSGWTDDSWGWSAAEAMPCSYSNPPKTAKVMWNARTWTEAPTVMPTVASPFGGVALNSSVGDRLVRGLSDDLRRSLDGTFAFWFCPVAETEGSVGSIRGVYSGSYFGNYSCYPPNLTFGDNGEIVVPNHVDGDWYLAVMRHDTLTASHSVDLLRERDGASFSASVADLTYIAALDAEADYLVEGLWALASVGDSGHWPFPGYGYFDLIGIWNRALTNDEVLALFNNGLGWQPG